MDSSYGGGAPVTAPGEEAAPAAAGDKGSVDQQNAMSDTALVPTKVLSPEGKPLNPGDEIVLRVVRVHGEDAEVEYAPKEGKEGPSGEGETSPDNTEAEIAALDKG